IESTIHTVTYLLLKGTEVAENLTLVLEESQGKQTGAITPRKLFGSWRRLSPPLSHLAVAHWGRIESEGIPPSSKQSSVTKTESCQPRCKPTEHSGEWEAVTEEDGGDTGRVDPSPNLLHYSRSGTMKGGSFLSASQTRSWKCHLHC
uniref:Uncharacterized protein n=1 Tax=Ursus americanus TaxID=9643 RepID=A0A452SL68_URSAM